MVIHTMVVAVSKLNWFVWIIIQIQLLFFPSWTQ